MAELESKTIHSVAKAIHLLDLLTAGGQPASLTELYQKTGWPKSTIHGLLSTMREAGLIEQNANGRYYQFGTSAALSILIMLITSLIIVLYIKVSNYKI